MIKLSIISLFLALAIIGCQNNTSKELDELQNFRAGNRKPQINFSDTTIKYNSTLISDPTSLDNNYRCGSFDSLGYLWLGKANTLVRYNGYDFKKFSYHPYIKNGIPAGEIKKLKIDKNNKIWILSSGFVYRFDPLLEMVDVPSISMELTSDFEIKNDSLLLFDQYGIDIYNLDGKFIKSHNTKEKNKYIIPKKLREKIISNDEISLDKIGDYKDTIKLFTINKKTKFIVIQSYELTNNFPADYGSILDEKDTIIYKKSDSTFWNGGAIKNQFKIDTITLKKGKYKLKYHTDDSHSWNAWNESQPEIFYMHGIKLIPYSSDFKKIKTNIEFSKFIGNGADNFNFINNKLYYFYQHRYDVDVYDLKTKKTEKINLDEIKKYGDSIRKLNKNKIQYLDIRRNYFDEKITTFYVHLKLTKELFVHNKSVIKYENQLLELEGNVQVFRFNKFHFLVNEANNTFKIYLLNFKAGEISFQILHKFTKNISQILNLTMDNSGNIYLFNYKGILKLSKNKFSTFLKNDGANVRYGKINSAISGIGNSLPSMRPLLDHSTGEFYMTNFTLSKLNINTKTFNHITEDSIIRKLNNNKQHFKNQDKWTKIVASKIPLDYQETTVYEYKISNNIFKNKFGTYFTFINTIYQIEEIGSGFANAYSNFFYVIKIGKKNQLIPLCNFEIYSNTLVDDSNPNKLLCINQDSITEIIDTNFRTFYIKKPQILNSTYNTKLKGYLWQFNGGFGLFKSNKFDTLYYEADTSNFSSGSNICNYNNKIWLATRKYLFSINPHTKKVNKIRLFNTPLQKDKVREKYLISNEFFDKFDLYFYKNQAILSTQISGLWIYNFDSEKWQTIRLSDGLLDDNILKTHLIKNEMWLTFSEGISVLNLESYEIRNYKFDSENASEVGFLCDNIWEQSFVYNKNILIPGDHGHHIFHLDRLNKYAPNVQLEQLAINDSINIDNSTLYYNRLIQLNHSENNLSGHFTALEFTEANQNKFAFRLKGFKDSWKVIGSRERSFEFTNIPPGKYTLEIIASNSDGYWSKPYILEIVILPPYWQTLWFRIGLIIILIGLIWFIIRWQTKKLRNRQIELENTVIVRTKEISHQKELVEEKQKEITDSINYAKRIQYSLLAHDDLLKNNLPEHFVLFKPKDIVSGDFYWASEKLYNESKKFYLAVCDSTGHGVPGAFMSLLNISFLNEGINEKNITEPNKVFDHVRNRLTENVDGGADGMDAILIQFDFEKKIMNYTAANNAPLLIRNNTIQELQKDKMPVGRSDKTNPFQLFNLTLEKGDCLYFYTDGYADQFGGEKGKKFKYANLNKLLIEIHNLPMQEQNEKLLTAFEKWRGDLEQVDDVCIIGIRI